MSKRILVVDDHDVVRQGVRLILRGQTQWQVVGEAENGVAAIEEATKLHPDLVILDITMPGKDGLEVIGELNKLESRSKILVLTMHDSKELTQRVQDLGAAGCIVKTSAARDLVKAIREVFSGGTFFPEGPATSTEKTRERRERKDKIFKVTVRQLAYQF